MGTGQLGGEFGAKAPKGRLGPVTKGTPHI